MAAATARFRAEVLLAFLLTDGMCNARRKKAPAERAGRRQKRAAANARAAALDQPSIT